MTEEWASGVGQMPLAEAQEVLAQLPERLAQGNQPLALTRSGAPVLAVLPWDLFESLVETLEIIGDPYLLEAIQDDMRAADDQSLVPLEQLMSNPEDEAVQDSQP